ncbi:MAG: flagellar filament outer layer protein FlaA [Spirochaetota bacterium]
MRKTALCAIISLLFAPAVLWAQQEDIDELRVGVETATQLIADIPVTHLEDADAWSANMPLDQGLILSMRRRGRPLEVPQVDPNDGTENNYVLGVKVAFTQRGYSRFRVSPPRPIKIPGITKAISMWVCGRSFRHRLYVHVLDYEGRPMILDMGLLDFVGWKKLSIAVPSSVRQYNYHNTEWRGISFNGVSIETDPAESYGTYYVYFDEIVARTDIYSEEHRDEDDIEDGW